MSTSGELLSMCKVLKHIKTECNKVRSVQHILSRKSHTIPSMQVSTSSNQNLDIRVKLAGSAQITAKPTINDVVGLKFGSVYTNHMLKIEYAEDYGGWQQPQITPLQEISLHPGSKVLQYAITLFEGMKAFRGIDGKIRMFRPKLNLNRLNESAERACLPPIDPEFLLKCIERLVTIEQEWVPYTIAGSLYIRPTVIATDPSLGVGWSNRALLYVILSPVGSYFGSEPQAVRLYADPNFTRAWPGGCGDKKMGSNYAPTAYVQRKAHENGCQQVLWLYGEEELVTEAGTMNIFVSYINDEGRIELATPPLNGLILPGITRLSLLELARQWNEFKVVERILSMSEIVKLSRENRLLEMFGCGTACVVCPVSSILYKGEIIEVPTISNTDPIHSRMFEAITNIQYGVTYHPWAHELPQQYSNQVEQSLQMAVAEL